MFEDDLKLILSFEGGYSNDPYDSGGETNKGITATTYDNFRKSRNLPTQSVKLISDDEVSAIYYGYYKDCGADRIATINPELATQLFDFAINAGSSQAVKTLQKLIGVTVDGVVGPDTLNHVKGIFSLPEEAKIYALARVAFYFRLCQQKPTNKTFLMSWLSRPLKIEGLI